MKTILLGYSDVGGKSSPTLLAGTEPQKQFAAAKAGNYPDGVNRIEMWDEDSGCKRRVAIKIAAPVAVAESTSEEQPKTKSKKSK